MIEYASEGPERKCHPSVATFSVFIVGGDEERSSGLYFFISLFGFDTIFIYVGLFFVVNVLVC